MQSSKTQCLSVFNFRTPSIFVRGRGEVVAVWVSLHSRSRNCILEAGIYSSASTPIQELSRKRSGVIFLRAGSFSRPPLTSPLRGYPIHNPRAHQSHMDGGEDDDGQPGQGRICADLPTRACKKSRGARGCTSYIRRTLRLSHPVILKAHDKCVDLSCLN
jgi:hypothetical protein